MNNDFLTIYLKGVEDGKDKKKREIDMLERKLYDLQQENKQLKEDKKKAIESIKDNYLYYYDRLDDYKLKLRYLDDISKLNEILGDKENE